MAIVIPDDNRNEKPRPATISPSPLHGAEVSPRHPQGQGCCRTRQGLAAGNRQRRHRAASRGLPRPRPPCGRRGCFTDGSRVASPEAAASALRCWDVGPFKGRRGCVPMRRPGRLRVWVSPYFHILVAREIEGSSSFWASSVPLASARHMGRKPYCRMVSPSRGPGPGELTSHQQELTGTGNEGEGTGRATRPCALIPAGTR